MSLGTSGAFNLPKRQSHYRFHLTPLADAMFQLLIFFMLSSSLTPYSLLTLKSAPETLAGTPDTPPPDGSGADGSGAGAATPPSTLWTVEAGRLRIGGQPFEFDTVDALADALVSADPGARVTLVVRSRATVQDVTAVLEALRAAGVSAIQVTSGAL